jgi:NAD(P)-dependent dehydrogenase (short-subunit alcohol dehydrogenase family)
VSQSVWAEQLEGAWEAAVRYEDMSLGAQRTQRDVEARRLSRLASECRKTLEARPPRVWLITGAGSGLGRALAEAVRDRGHLLVATARRVEALAGLEGDRVLTLPLDVRDEQQITAALRDAVDRFGRVDVLVNAAGRAFVGALEEMTLSDLRDVMETMFFGPAALTRAVVPIMRRQGSGTVLQISSVGGQVAGPGGGAYCAAKFALEGLSEALAAEVGSFGVRVLIVEPGSFRTEILGRGLGRAKPLAAYSCTVGPVREQFAAQHHRQPGDPGRAAAAIMRALDAPQPPLRLVLGEDAIDSVRFKHATSSAELSRWESVGRATAYGSSA